MNRPRGLKTRFFMGYLLLYLGALAALGLAGLAARDAFTPRPVINLSLQSAQGGILPVQEPGGQVNLNTATKEELMSLPGIGSHLAEQIIRQREAQPFFFLEDLRQVSGIGEKRLDALRGLAYVELPIDPLNDNKTE